jgi:O-antigen biosynthesis protein
MEPVMSLRIRQFFSYWKKFGFIQTVIYTLFWLFPSKFALLYRTGARIVLDYKNIVVLDYKKWTDCEGVAVPADVSPKDAARQCFIWFVPAWTNVWGGGHYTLFRFANHFAQHDIRNIIYIYNHETARSLGTLQNDLEGALKNCSIEVIVDPRKLPSCDAAFATTWQSAYFVRSFPFARRKFYFMQDYESYFYAFGTASLQANNSYTFGFLGITGGHWLRSCYESYNNRALNYTFAADKNIFFPTRPDARVNPQVRRLFFYGRPSTDRRCFELGIKALTLIAAEFPDVEILVAGLDLDQTPPFKATMLGNLTLRKTGQLYRTCDVGLSFSGTNLSYIPVELMASGCAVISNNGPQVEWMCRHRENSYLCAPVPTAVLDGFRELYNNAALRQKIVDGGIKTTSAVSWESEIEKIYQYVITNLETDDGPVKRDLSGNRSSPEGPNA